MRSNIRLLSHSAIIAALYVVLTFFSALFGLSSGAVQIRLSEVLCILPMFSVAAVPGVTIGCFLANLLTGSLVTDVIFGTVATLIGTIGTYVFRNNKIISFLSPILSNSLIIPIVLINAYGIQKAYLYLFFSVLIGEIVSVGILGFILYRLLNKRNIF